jgi:hypothetical protein
VAFFDIPLKHNLIKSFVVQHQFPPALIAKCQKVISQKAGIEISEDQAVLYLEKFARLMMVTVKIMQQSKAKKSKKQTQ